VVKSVLTQITTAFHAGIFADFVKGYPYILMLMVLGYILHFIPSSIEKYTEQLVIKSPFILKVTYLLVIVFIVIQIKSSEIQPFIYFQF